MDRKTTVIMKEGKGTVLMRVEPSKRLSEILGFPYFFERSFTIQELLDNGLIDEADIIKMELGQEIRKSIKVLGRP